MCAASACLCRGAGGRDAAVEVVGLRCDSPWQPREASFPTGGEVALSAAAEMLWSAAAAAFPVAEEEQRGRQEKLLEPLSFLPFLPHRW